MKKMVLIFLTLLLVNLNSSVFAQADIRALHLTWSEDTKSTQTITWQMHEFNPNIRVEYGEIGLPADFPKKVMADVEPFPDETGVSHVYHVTLQGLKSNKEYFYRIVDGDILPQILIFHVQVQILNQPLQDRTAGNQHFVIICQLASHLQICQRRQRCFLGQHKNAGCGGIYRRHQKYGNRTAQTADQQSHRQYQQKLFL